MPPTRSGESTGRRSFSSFFSTSSSNSNPKAEPEPEPERGRRSPLNPPSPFSFARSSTRDSLDLQPTQSNSLFSTSNTGKRSGPGSRAASPAPLSNPGNAPLQTHNLRLPHPAFATEASATEASPNGVVKRRSWFSRPHTLNDPSISKSKAEKPPKAWIAGYEGMPAYDLTLLLQGWQLPELWDETGDTLVYLFPTSWQRGPSFKIRSEAYASSTKLVDLARSDMAKNSNTSRLVKRKRLEVATAMQGMRLDSQSPQLSHVSSPQESTENSSSGSSRHTRDTDDFDDVQRPINLHLPLTFSQQANSNIHVLSETDTEILIDVRNMFAFLIGQSLVSTERRQSIFALFMNISKALQAYDFTNIDGSTFGEAASNSFDIYVEELNIGDIRPSREKTIEGLALGERMRSVSLYNEAFVHAVGKYEDVQYISKFPGPDFKFNLITSVTKSRLERASIDLLHREKSIDSRLINFDFPSLFAGVMNSRMVDERNVINFGAWRNYFNLTRKYVLSYLKMKYGSWPPKASSKKNDLETGGLNRIVLKALYFDFSDMYDLYVDRQALTTRSMNILYDGATDGEHPDEPVARILRRVFDEYDRSSPPVQPPMPFDIPIMPNTKHLPRQSKLASVIPSEARKLGGKKLSSNDLSAVLDSSTNTDTLINATPEKGHFMAAMRSFEARQARNSSLAELTDLRAGMWMFIYSVLQALPMLVVDAPGVKWHDGVEYFLCEPPRSGVPWARAANVNGADRGWYSVSGGAGVVNLPSDLIEHGVEGIYRRSHAWLMGAKWSAALPSSVSSPVADARPSNPQYTIEQERKEQGAIRRYETKRLAPPRMPAASDERAFLQRSSFSHDGRRRDNVLGTGLEALPLPPGVAPTGGRTRAVSASGLDQRSLPDGVPPFGPSAIRQQPSQEQRKHAAKPSGATFDDILSSIDRDKGKKRT